MATNVKEGDPIANIQFDVLTQAPKIGRVHVAILAFDQQTSVTVGENRGKKLPHDFVVIGYKTRVMKSLNNALVAKLSLPSTEKFQSAEKALVVWVSKGNDPRPIQATGDWLKL